MRSGEGDLDGEDVLGISRGNVEGEGWVFVGGWNLMGDSRRDVAGGAESFGVDLFTSVPLVLADVVKGAVSFGAPLFMLGLLPLAAAAVGAAERAGSGAAKERCRSVDS